MSERDGKNIIKKDERTEAATTTEGNEGGGKRVAREYTRDRAGKEEKKCQNSEKYLKNLY